MQTLYYKENHIHPIFNEFDALYKELSEKTKQHSLIEKSYDNAFKPLVDIFKKYSFEGDFNFVDKKYKKLSLPKKDKTMIVCFSGGKDSAATALYYLKRNYKVILYHVKHINPPLYDEYIQAEEFAKYWNIPIFIDEIKLSGKHDYIEHPMKNMIIANMAIECALKNNLYPNIAFGNYTTSSLEDDNFEFCGGDDIEMWETYSLIIRKIIPRFQVHVVLTNVGETLETICVNKQLLDMTVSCLGRASMRDYWHNWVKEKFNIEIPKHRCGRCYKCCIEYIYMADHDLQEFSEEYYMYCLNNLKKNVERELGVRCTLENVWYHYFFYEGEKSKCIQNVFK